MRRLILLIAVLLLHSGSTGFFSELLADARCNHFMISQGKWADTDLPDLPGKVVSGNLEFKDAYYFAMTYGRTLVDDFSIPTPFPEIRLKGWDLELESSLLKHYRLQSHWEATCALVLRTRPFVPLSFLGWTFAGGFGGSYAFEKPALEKGPDGTPGEDSKQFQSHIVLELDLFHPAFVRIHLIGRIHHRSGIYGIISPQKTGSNFIAGGIRFDL